MLSKNTTFVHISQTMKSTFSELKIGSLLRHSGISKKSGISCFDIFQILFLLVFEHQNWFQAGTGKKSSELPGKDTIYRFLKNPTFNWRKFLSLLSFNVIRQFSTLTSAERTSVFILDDSVYDRKRSKKVELLSYIHNHTTNRFVKGFEMLTLGWSDGFSFVPVDFALVGSKTEEKQLCKMNESLDKRTSGYKRRVESSLKKPDISANMIENALKNGINAEYVLMDTWFTHAPLIENLDEKGLFVIGMVKQLKQSYVFNNQTYKLPELFKVVRSNLKKNDILGSIQVQLNTENQTKVRIVFVRNRNKKSEWLAVLTTDMAISEEEIIRIYGIRWEIETFFKCTKSYLKLGKEFQCRSFDALVSHTTLVFTRYILLEWMRRKEQDPKTIGQLFFLMCEDVKDVDVITALRNVFSIFITVSKDMVSLEMLEMKSQLTYWFESLPSYIKDSLIFSGCES